MKRACVWMANGFFAVLVLFQACGTGAAQEWKPSPTVDEVLSWLPANTEAVLFARGPLRIKPPPEKGLVTDSTGRFFDPTGREVPSPVGPSLPERMIEANLSMFDFHDARRSAELRRQSEEALSRQQSWSSPTGDFMASLSQQELLYGLMAGRNFGPVTSIPDGSPFEGCQVAVFKERIRETAMAKLKQSVSELKTIAKTRVFEVRNVHGDEHDIRYFAQPWSNVLVASNNEPQMTSLLTRIRQQSKSRALPSHLPEWRHVDRTSPAWGVRHYSRKQPSDKHAIGLTYSYGKNTNQVDIHYVSHAHDRDQLIAAFLTELDGESHPSKKVGDDAALVRLSIPRVKYQASLEATGIIFAILGWVVFP